MAQYEDKIPAAVKASGQCLSSKYSSGGEVLKRWSGISSARQDWPRIPDKEREGELTNVSPHFSRQEVSAAAPPLDFSFQRIKSLDKIHKPPRKLRVGCPKKNEQNVYATRSLWLNNNEIRILSGLGQLNQFIPQISWLDLSYNKIREIPDEIVNLEQLVILYLHENDIYDFYEVEKLGKLIRLRTLTLFGNPIEEISFFRNNVLQSIPRLKKLDHSFVINTDRLKPR